MSDAASDSALIVLGILILLVPVMGIVMGLTPYLMPKRECFAVTVPDSAVADPCLRRLKRRYLAIMLALSAAATAACAASLQGGPSGTFAAVLTVSLLVLCIGGYGLMLFFRARVRAYKAQQGWTAEGRRTVGYVGDEPFPKPISLAWNLLYLPVLAVTVAMGIAGYGTMPARIPMQMDFEGHVTTWADKSPAVVMFPVLFVLFMGGCFLLCHWMITRSKKGSDPAMPAASAWAYGMFARAQSILLVALGLMFSLMGPLMELAFTGVLSLDQVLVPVMAMAAVAVVASIAVSVIYGQNGSRLIARMGESDAMPRDDDRFWKLGIFYVNRDDASLFLPERFGIGWTINWGRPGAWVLMLALVLVTVAFVAFCLSIG